MLKSYNSMLPAWLLAACAVPIVLVLYKFINDGIFTGSAVEDDELRLRAYLEKLEARGPRGGPRRRQSTHRFDTRGRQRMTWPKSF